MQNIALIPSQLNMGNWKLVLFKEETQIEL